MKCHPNLYLQNAWNKYGEHNFKFEIICCIEKIEDLILCENYWINTLESHSSKNGYNIDLFYLNSEKRIISEETKKKISIAQLGEKNHMFGKKHSEETKRKRSLATKGTRVGKDNPMYGTTLSPEAKAKFVELGREASSKEWEIILPSKEKIKIKNLSKFCKQNNLNYSRMVRSNKNNAHKEYYIIKMEGNGDPLL